MTNEASVRAARDAYQDALDKAWVASGKAFEAAGTDAYDDARDAFATAYAELNYARCAYAAALTARCPTTTTEERAMTEFEVGDIVRLNSNPNILMTVYSIDPYALQPAIVTRGARTVIKCVWFDANGLIRYEDLDSRVLTKTTYPSEYCND